MGRWFFIRISLSLIILIAITIFIGEVLTGPASTAVESLSSDLPAESVRIPLDSGSRVHEKVIYS